MITGFRHTYSAYSEENKRANSSSLASLAIARTACCTVDRPDTPCVDIDSPSASSAAPTLRVTYSFALKSQALWKMFLTFLVYLQSIFQIKIHGHRRIKLHFSCQSPVDVSQFLCSVENNNVISHSLKLDQIAEFHRIRFSDQL